jgi:hypothetical protein
MTPIALVVVDEAVEVETRSRSQYCVDGAHVWCVVCAPLDFSLGVHDKEVARRRWGHNPAALAAAINARDLKLAELSRDADRKARR